MISISICDYCIHQRELKDGWKPTCVAFPKGIPVDFHEDTNKICNGEYKFKPLEDKKLPWE